MKNVDKLSAKDLEEMDKMLILLQEYTVKLREQCEKQAARVSLERQFDYLLFIIAGGSFTITLLLSFNNPTDLSNSPGLLVAPLLFITTSLVYLFKKFIFVFPGIKFKFELEQLVIAVESLTRIVSQFGEHSSKSISSRFEMGLRLSEAEATLKLYKELFGSRQAS